MEKAYDVKELLVIMKSKGLDLAEDAALVAFESVTEWFKQSAKISTTPYDDMALLILPQIEAVVKSGIDKIDGKVG